MKNIEKNEKKLFDNSQKWQFSFLNIVLIFCVFYILEIIFSTVFSFFNLYSIPFMGWFVTSALTSFLSFYITIKYLLTGLHFSDEVKDSNEKQNGDRVNHTRSWNKGLVIFVWTMPIINFIPMFIIWLGAAMGAGRGNIGLVGLFGGFLPLIGLVVAFLQFKKKSNFGTYSIHLIPTFLSFFELFLVLISSRG